MGSLGAGELACRTGDDGSPANGIVLMAQAVDTASRLPCLDAVPLGWHLSDVQVRDGSGRFWLDSDRDGARAIEVALTASCDTRTATEIPSDREDVRRLESVRRISPEYAGTRYYVFDGGCLTFDFHLGGDSHGEALALASELIGALPRGDLRTQVTEDSNGRLSLDPAVDGGGGP